jgi:hypothetical protein
MPTLQELKDRYQKLQKSLFILDDASVSPQQCQELLDELEKLEALIKACEKN